MRCHMQTTIIKPSQKPKAKAKSQEPKAKSQKPKIQKQKAKAKSQKPKANQRFSLQNATNSMQIRDFGTKMQQIARKTAPDWKKILKKKQNKILKRYTLHIICQETTHTPQKKLTNSFIKNSSKHSYEPLPFFMMPWCSSMLCSMPWCRDHPRNRRCNSRGVSHRGWGDVAKKAARCSA